MLAKLGRPSVLWLAPLLVAVAAPAFAQGQGEEKPVVTAAVQVTNNPDPVRAHSSPQIAVNPKTGEPVIVETDVYGGFGLNVHVSVDDGRSWFWGGDPMMKPYTWNSDLAINGPYATMAFDGEGVLYVAFSATDPKFAGKNRNERPRSIFLAKSSDSGRTWTTTFAYRAPEDNPEVVLNRRPMVALDPSNSSNVYVGWMQSVKGMVAASTDGGKTFSQPVVIGDEKQRHYQPRLAVDSKGALHAVYPSGEFVANDPPVRNVFYRRSADRGKTWSDPVVIEPGSAGFFHNRKHLLAADPNSGSLYFIYYGNVKEKPTAEDDNEIFVRTSADGGKTWSDRVTVNDDAHMQNVQHYDAGISIAPDGRVDVAWYDFRNSPAPETIPKDFAAPFNVGGWTDVYYSSSTDRGKSWRPNVRITDRIIDRRIGVWSNNVHSHYNVGVASTADAVYFAWQDSRNGDEVTNTEDVYFASLKLAGPQPAVAGTGGPPAWAVAGAGVALGMGVAMVIALGLARRQASPARVPG